MEKNCFDCMYLEGVPQGFWCKKTLLDVYEPQLPACKLFKQAVD